MHCILFWLFVNGLLTYELQCPVELHRKIRAQIVCDGKSTDHYSCFLDQFSQKYKESCKDAADFVRPGKKYVIGIFRKNTDCDLRRYQPFKFWSHQLSQCVFSKSRCNDEGQILHNHGSTFGDSVCRCDYRQGYAFLNNTIDPCYCIPSEEDCSCYKKICPLNYRLAQDYQCKLSVSGNSSCPDVTLISYTPKTTTESFDVKDKDNLTRTTRSYTCQIVYTVLIAPSILIILVLCIKRQKEKRIFRQNGLINTQTATVDRTINHQIIIYSSSDDAAALTAGALKQDFKFLPPSQEATNSHSIYTCYKGCSEEKTEAGEEIRQRAAIYSAKSFVVAIDIGTTYSGNAFSERNTPTNIITCSWKKRTFHQSVSMKTPTSVLLNKNKKCVAFGFKAEDKYFESIDDEDRDPKDEFHYFNQFKMMLHMQTVNLDTTITDQNGVQMKAVEIFSIAIKYLKDQAIKMLVKLYGKIEGNNIHYVLTVSAISKDQTKQFMRNAAEKAEIQGKDLTIVLEPEAALIYCRQELYTNSDTKAFSETMSIDSQIMVVDLGGGSADITIHQCHSGGSFEEVCLRSQGDLGGTSVDRAFLEFVNSVFTKKVITELHANELEDYITLFHEFEVKKRTITTENSTDIVITLPASLLEITRTHCTSVHAAIKGSNYKESVSFNGQKLYVKPDAFRKLFKSTIDLIVKHIDELLKHPNFFDLNLIIMVGGFSECELVQTAMRQNFPKIKLFIPEDAGLAVLKGAVIYGHQ